MNFDNNDRVKKAIEVLEERIKGLEKLGQSYSANNYDVFFQNLKRWIIDTSALISKYINPKEGKDFKFNLIQQMSQDPYSDFIKRTQKAYGFMDSLKNSLQQNPDLFFDVDTKDEKISSTTDETPQISNNKIFVVHGHDEIAKNELEIFLKNSGLEPIVLHRQPDQGRTIIEKFEVYSDVGFALIILTPDDVFYTLNEENKKYELAEKRARQNVIFEWGFFVGKLGRDRVCCLHKKSVELPSDIHGVLYKPFNDSIKDTFYDLLQELKAAGYNVKF